MTTATSEGFRPHDPKRAGLCNVRAALRRAGLRPTRQRLALGQLLFSGDGRHVSAESLHDEATRTAVPVSLATVYNTLNQFTEAGLLREIAVDGTRSYYDTNVSDHHHFLVEDTREVLDIPAEHLSLDALPEPPEGMEIARIDVVVRLRRKAD
jgi:Fur family iron response transcriptional regulator